MSRQRGYKHTPETIEKTALRGIRLAGVTEDPHWLDWVFRVYRNLGKVLPAVLIDELHPAIRQLKYPASSTFTSYVDRMRAAANELTPAERFLVQRLEGLYEVASTCG